MEKVYMHVMSESNWEALAKQFKRRGVSYLRVPQEPGQSFVAATYPPRGVTVAQEPLEEFETDLYGAFFYPALLAALKKYVVHADKRRITATKDLQIPKPESIPGRFVLKVGDSKRFRAATKVRTPEGMRSMERDIVEVPPMSEREDWLARMSELGVVVSERLEEEMDEW